MRIHVAVALASLLMPTAALAQARPQPGTAAGTLVLVRLDNSLVVAPDYKITSFDGETGQLIGATGGWSQENTMFIGGAWYWLANGSHDHELNYGGLLVGWNVPANRRLQFGARGLVGFGTARLGVNYLVPGPRDGRLRGGSQGTFPATITRSYLAQDDFFVFEPQGSLGAAITRHVRLNLAAGYRLTGAGDILEDRLNGVTGNIPLEFRFF